MIKHDEAKFLVRAGWRPLFEDFSLSEASTRWLGWVDPETDTVCAPIEAVKIQKSRQPQEQRLL